MFSTDPTSIGPWRYWVDTSCPARPYLSPRTQSLHPQSQARLLGLPTCVSVESLGDGIRPAWVKEPLSTGLLTCISSPTDPHQKGRRRGRRIKKKKKKKERRSPDEGPGIPSLYERKSLRRQNRSGSAEWAQEMRSEGVSRI